jgi:hypothetical protein
VGGIVRTHSQAIHTNREGQTMGFDEKMVKKGQGEPREGLLQQGEYHLTLGRELATDLAACNWGPDKTDKLDADVQLLGSAMGAQAEARGLSKSATGSEIGAISEAKELIGALRNAAPLVLRENPVPGVSKESFESGGPLARSTPRIRAYLEKVRPAVETLDSTFQKYMRGQSPLARLDDIKTRLVESDAKQENLVSKLPEDTQRIYECKGLILQAIEDMNRTARIAFAGKAEVVARFNKDILQRARKAKKKEPAPSAPE